MKIFKLYKLYRFMILHLAVIFILTPESLSIQNIFKTSYYKQREREKEKRCLRKTVKR